ncbi:two-component system sensor histidine kinase YesM [Metabacillus crassostreae]|uniref:sensor histidine kinase n=1 Tax=Metabacillus crassostreae TaxID=929098 RepID=UPI001958BD6D|nr:histidine kinase [Metabacillus crassostreae]MBM7604190.1 two-component system sensor histidine kinase YesM [Metabacillus crassostreae]
MLRKIKKIFLILKQRFEQLSLQNKLISLYIFIFMIPAISFTLYYSDQLYESSIKDIKNKNEYLLKIEEIHIKNNIESMRRTAQLVASDHEFIEYIKTRNETNINELIDFKMNAFSNVAKLQQNNPTIEDIHLFTNNPYVTEMWPLVLKEKRISHMPWYNDVNNRNGIEFWAFNEKGEDLLERNLYTSNSPRISLLREVEYPKDIHLGIVEISMLLSNFFPKMYSGIQDEQSEMILFDSEMNVFQNTQNNFLKSQQINASVIKDQLSKFRKESGTFQFKYKNIPYLIVSTYIEEIDAHMLNVISLENIYADMKQTRNLIVTGTFILVIILSVITYFLISLLLKRMYKLIHSMKRVKDGDLSLTVEINGQGEFAVLAYHFQEMLSKINGLIAETVNKQAATKEAELKALKTQIDSHFLYNTLENIKMMAEIEGKYDISDSLTSLGEMMRYNLRWKKDFVELREELTHIQNYIDIMNLRLDNCLSLVINVPEKLMSQKILKMSLQPIVENAVKHGITPRVSIGNGVIEINVSIDHGFVVLEIIDNGIGMSNELLMRLNKNIRVGVEPEQDYMQKQSGGIGLRNVNDRIQLHYGNDYGLTVESKPDHYTKVVVLMPYLIIKGRE